MFKVGHRASVSKVSKVRYLFTGPTVPTLLYGLLPKVQYQALWPPLGKPTVLSSPLGLAWLGLCEENHTLRGSSDMLSSVTLLEEYGGH
jgi:hypothetical protein